MQIEKTPVTVLRNIACLVDCLPVGGQSDVVEIRDAALAWEGSQIAWRGTEKELPKLYSNSEWVDARRRLVIPGLVDCHTHLAFGGWRADEFQARALGKSYLQIAQAGGGILSTVRATRAASPESLLDKCFSHLNEISRLGVTCVECKSGYGLDTATELKLLRVYRELQKKQPLRIIPTFLGAHTIPPEFRSDRESYVDLVINEMLPAVSDEKLARFCDVFVEDSAFTLEEARRILEAAVRLGMRPRVHADQLTDGNGAALAAEAGAIAADHLECISDQGIRALRGKGVIAVGLPLASVYLGQPPMPARKLIDSGVKVAIATDFNPGSAPSYHLPLAMTLACTLLGMTPVEALRGATLHAAEALDLQASLGSLEPGKQADFAVIDAPSVNHWLYHFRPNACVATYVGGHKIWDAGAGKVD